MAKKRNYLNTERRHNNVKGDKASDEYQCFEFFDNLILDLYLCFGRNYERPQTQIYLRADFITSDCWTAL